MFKGSGLAKLKRFGCAVIGILIIAVGVYSSRFTHGFSYRNWFGGLVFGPVAVLLGTVALLGAVLDWPKVWDSPSRESARKRHR
jgi:hypothetical protein